MAQNRCDRNKPRDWICIQNGPVIFPLRFWPLWSFNAYPVLWPISVTTILGHFEVYLVFHLNFSPKPSFNFNFEVLAFFDPKSDIFLQFLKFKSGGFGAVIGLCVEKTVPGTHFQSSNIWNLKKFCFRITTQSDPKFDIFENLNKFSDFKAFFQMKPVPEK